MDIFALLPQWPLWPRPFRWLKSKDKYSGNKMIGLAKFGKLLLTSPFFWLFHSCFGPDF